MYQHQPHQQKNQLGVTSPASPSVISYEKKTKTLYISICPNARFGYSSLYKSYTAISLVGTYLSKNDGTFFSGSDNTFAFTTNYETSTTTTTLISWRRINSLTSSSVSEPFNTPMSLNAQQISSGSIYMQSLFIEGGGTNYILQTNSMMMVHKQYVPSNNTTFDLLGNNMENMGRYIVYDQFANATQYFNTDTTGQYIFIVRVDDDAV